MLKNFTTRYLPKRKNNRMSYWISMVILSLTMTPSFVQGTKTSSDVESQTWTKHHPGKAPPFLSQFGSQKEGTVQKRNPPQLTVQKTPEGLVVAIYLGYPLKKGAPVDIKITVGRTEKCFQFFPLEASHNDWAFTDADQKVIEAMKQGSTMTVEATSQRGTTSTDIYSLMGFTHALTDLT